MTELEVGIKRIFYKESSFYLRRRPDLCLLSILVGAYIAPMALARPPSYKDQDLYY